MESKHSKFGLDTHKDLVWINVVSHVPVHGRLNAISRV